MKKLKDPNGDGEEQLRIANKRKILEDEIESREMKVIVVKLLLNLVCIYILVLEDEFDSREMKVKGGERKLRSIMQVIWILSLLL